MGCCGVDQSGSDWVQCQPGCYENGSDPSGLIKDADFGDNISDSLRKDFGHWNWFN
jgi:hypothetical protein